MTLIRGDDASVDGDLRNIRAFNSGIVVAASSDDEVLDSSVIVFAGIHFKHHATLLSIDGGRQRSIFIDGPLDGDGFAARVEVVFVVGAGRDVDHVAID